MLLLVLMLLKLSVSVFHVLNIVLCVLAKFLHTDTTLPDKSSAGDGSTFRARLSYTAEFLSHHYSTARAP